MTELEKYREQERGSLIDNLYRAGKIKDYHNTGSYSLEELREMWRNYRP